MYGRKKYLEMLYKSNLKCISYYDADFGRRELINNWRENNILKIWKIIYLHFVIEVPEIFRIVFYETFMMGRIPIFVNTDCVIPFWDKIKDLNFGIICNEEDLQDNLLIDIIKFYIEKYKNDLIDIQKQNRKLWETYFSPCGFLLETIKDIDEKQEYQC